MRCCRISPIRGRVGLPISLVYLGQPGRLPKTGPSAEDGTVQDGPHCNRTLAMALFADVFPASVKLVTANPSTLRADKSTRPTLLKQVCFAGFLCLKPLPKLLEAHPFLLTHFRRHLPLVRLFYHFHTPFIHYFILRLVDLSQ